MKTLPLAILLLLSALFAVTATADPVPDKPDLVASADDGATDYIDSSIELADSEDFGPTAVVNGCKCGKSYISADKCCHKTPCACACCTAGKCDKEPSASSAADSPTATPKEDVSMKYRFTHPRAMGFNKTETLPDGSKRTVPVLVSPGDVTDSHYSFPEMFAEIEESEAASPLPSADTEVVASAPESVAESAPVTASEPLKSEDSPEPSGAAPVFTKLDTLPKSLAAVPLETLREAVAEVQPGLDTSAMSKQELSALIKTLRD